MKLDALRFSTAVANVWAMAALFCAIVYKLAPGAYATTANFLLHTDMYHATRVVGWGELILAVVVWWGIVALFAGAAAIMYNRTARA